jgi:hypothetical protein
VNYSDVVCEAQARKWKAVLETSRKEATLQEFELDAPGGSGEEAPTGKNAEENVGDVPEYTPQDVPPVPEAGTSERVDQLDSGDHTFYAGEWEHSPTERQEDVADEATVGVDELTQATDKVIDESGRPAHTVDEAVVGVPESSPGPSKGKQKVGESPKQCSLRNLLLLLRQPVTGVVELRTPMRTPMLILIPVGGSLEKGGLLFPLVGLLPKCPEW